MSPVLVELLLFKNTENFSTILNKVNSYLIYFKYVKTTLLETFRYMWVTKF